MLKVKTLEESTNSFIPPICWHTVCSAWTMSTSLSVLRTQYHDGNDAQQRIVLYVFKDFPNNFTQSHFLHIFVRFLPPTTSPEIPSGSSCPKIRFPMRSIEERRAWPLKMCLCHSQRVKSSKGRRFWIIINAHVLGKLLQSVMVSKIEHLSYPSCSIIRYLMIIWRVVKIPLIVLF